MGDVPMVVAFGGEEAARNLASQRELERMVEGGSPCAFLSGQRRCEQQA